MPPPPPPPSAPPAPRASASATVSAGRHLLWLACSSWPASAPCSLASLTSPPRAAASAVVGAAFATPAAHDGCPTPAARATSASPPTAHTPASVFTRGPTGALDWPWGESACLACRLTRWCAACKTSGSLVDPTAEEGGPGGSEAGGKPAGLLKPAAVRFNLCTWRTSKDGGVAHVLIVAVCVGVVWGGGVRAGWGLCWVSGSACGMVELHWVGW
eukprot:scaffold10567_cov56-Phaeocystis_antarctica.AAC.4